MRASSNRKTWVPETRALRPLGANPQSTPVWVPVRVQRAMRESPSSIHSFTASRASGIPSMIPCTTNRTPSGPRGRSPQHRVVVDVIVGEDLVDDVPAGVPRLVHLTAVCLAQRHQSAASPAGRGPALCSR